MLVTIVYPKPGLILVRMTTKHMNTSFSEACFGFIWNFSQWYIKRYRSSMKFVRILVCKI
jgi:hypothetical protein